MYPVLRARASVDLDAEHVVGILAADLSAIATMVVIPVLQMVDRKMSERMRLMTVGGLGMVAGSMTMIRE